MPLTNFALTNATKRLKRTSDKNVHFDKIHLFKYGVKVLASMHADIGTRLK